MVKIQNDLGQDSGTCPYCQGTDISIARSILSGNTNFCRTCRRSYIIHFIEIDSKEQIANIIISKIHADLADRMGFDDVLCSISTDVLEQMKTCWKEIIYKAIEKKE
ncbi:MAG TPA: hypothetical protein PKN48_00270 [Bacteroidales bacterium]|nr:hypothetical protein [Bacteroidales bacterium]